MTSFFRSSRSIRAINPTTRFPVTAQVQTQQRFNSHSSYGNGESKPEDDRNKPTRDIEHPGPPPPNVSKEGSSKSQPSYKQSESSSGEVEEDNSTRPSNKAKPTITDGHQSANIDREGNMKPGVPKDVKKHNEDIDQRYDKPYNWIKDEGKVGKGF